MPVYLIGFMGSGKTTIGKKLAKKLDWLFIDLDDYIENKYGKSINWLFEEKGESLFRKLERQCLEEVSELKEVVVSTGGGTPCFLDNMNLIKKTGVSIYLKGSAKALMDRLHQAKSQRPLLNKIDNETELLKYIELKLGKRQLHYEKANHIVNLVDLKVHHIVELIEKA